MAGPDTLNYGQLMQKAMRRMTAEVLGHVAEHGLPGDHHFYISFETGHPGVDMPDWLRDTYPEEMTIVLQDWFADLAVTQDRFSVTLNFSDQPQALVIPLDAIRTFVDPSVKFGLKFDAHEASETDAEFPGEEPLEDEAEEPVVEDDREPETTGAGAEVVSLDKFRKT
jgi:hypothetical protein